MTRLSLVLAASLALSVPVAAESLAVLLPSLSFPDTTVTTSTKGCEVRATQAICQLEE